MFLLAKLANSLRNNEAIKVCYFTKDLNTKNKVWVQKSLPHSHAEGSILTYFLLYIKTIKSRQPITLTQITRFLLC